MIRRSCRVLVVGGGLAGLQAAEVVAQFVSGVLVVDRRPPGAAPAPPDATVLAAYLAQDAGGVSDWKSSRVSLGVRGAGDDPGAGAEREAAVRRGFHAYVEEILRHGADLGDARLADFTAAGIYNRIGWLESYGLHLVRTPTGAYRGFPSPGHSVARVQLVEEATAMVLDAIRRSAERFGVAVASGLHVTRIFVDGGQVTGAYALDVASGEGVVIDAGTVILAGGGADRLYRAERDGTVGDSVRLALDAGAEVAGMEFVAFAPESERLPAGLLHVLLGLGATLAPESESSAPRSLRELTRELARGDRPVRARIPSDVVAAVADAGAFAPYLSQLGSPIDVHVGCRGLLGGVVNRACATSVRGLFVAGAAATGAHGADVLPGVDTSFALYSAENAGSAAAAWAAAAPPSRVSDGVLAGEAARLANLPGGRPEGAVEAAFDEVRQIMWEGAGVERSAEGLRRALARLLDLRARIEKPGTGHGAPVLVLAEFDSLLTAGELVCRAALARDETLGQHVRTDFPKAAAERAWITFARRHGPLEMTRTPAPARG